MKLATHLSQGKFEGIHVPSEERKDYRAITRLREKFVRHRTRIGCQLKSLLFQKGMIAFDHEKPVSEKWLKELQDKIMSDEIRYAVGRYCKMWLYLTGEIKNIEAKMLLQEGEDEFIEAVYRSSPGIGVVSARALANELGDMMRFGNER